jgi:hypothetical protein
MTMTITIKLKPRQPNTISHQQIYLPFKGPLVAGLNKQIGQQFSVTRPNTVKVNLPVQFTGFETVFGCRLQYTWGDKRKWIEDKDFLLVNLRFGMIAFFETQDDRKLAEDWLAQQNDRLTVGET